MKAFFLIQPKFKFIFPLLTFLFFALLASTPILVRAAVAPALRMVSGSDQQTTYTSEFFKPLKVAVLNPVNQRPIRGVRVQFTPSRGIALSELTVETDADGIASVEATGLSVGVSSVRAEIAGLPGSGVQFQNLVTSKAVLTVVPVDVQSTVGVVPAITEYTIEGFVKGETEESAKISGTARLTTIATETSPDANYAIKGEPGTLTSPNYTFRTGYGTLVLRGTGKGAHGENSSTAVLNLPTDAPTVKTAIHILNVPSPAAFKNLVVRQATTVSATDLLHAQDREVRGTVMGQTLSPPRPMVQPVVRQGVFSSRTPASDRSYNEPKVQHALPSQPVRPETSSQLPAMQIHRAMNPPAV